MQVEDESLLNFAEKYDVYMMKDDIALAMKELLNAQNAFRFLDLAYEYELRELEAVALAVVHENFWSEEMLANIKVSIY